MVYIFLYIPGNKVFCTVSRPGKRSLFLVSHSSWHSTTEDHKHQMLDQRTFLRDTQTLLMAGIIVLFTNIAKMEITLVLFTSTAKIHKAHPAIFIADIILKCGGIATVLQMVHAT